MMETSLQGSAPAASSESVFHPGFKEVHLTYKGPAQLEHALDAEVLVAVPREGGAGGLAMT